MIQSKYVGERESNEIERVSESAADSEVFNYCVLEHADHTNKTTHCTGMQILISNSVSYTLPVRKSPLLLLSAHREYVISAVQGKAFGDNVRTLGMLIGRHGYIPTV